MNMANVSQGRMIAAAGGVVLIIAIFLNWAGGQSAWNGFSIVHILMLLIGIAAIALALLPATGSTVAVPPAFPLVVAALGVAVFGFAVGWEFEISGEIGVWLAIIGSAGIAYGAYETSRSPGAPVATRPTATTTPPPPSTPAV